MEKRALTNDRLVAYFAYGSDDIELHFNALRATIANHQEHHLAALARAEAAEERLRAFEDLEAALGRVVLRAQHAVDEMLAQAGRDAAAIVAEAHRHAERLVANPETRYFADHPGKAVVSEQELDAEVSDSDRVALTSANGHRSGTSTNPTPWWTRPMKVPSLVDRSDPFFNPVLRWRPHDGADNFLAQLADAPESVEHEDVLPGPTSSATTDTRPGGWPSPVSDDRDPGRRRRHRRAHAASTPSLTRRLGIVLGFTRF